MNDLVRAKLKDMKLSGIAKTIDMRNEEAIREGLSFMEFFELLLNDESNNRVSNARIKRIASAKFPNHKTIEVVLCQYFGHKKSNFFKLHF